MRLSALLRAKREKELREEPTVNAEEHPGEESVQETVHSLPIERIQPNRFQPRQVFTDESLAELARSIEQHGLLQPIVVRRIDQGYELLVGERRLRACQQLGWREIRAIVRDVDDEVSAVIALVENLQRESLGIFEEAEGIHRLREEFHLTQREIAECLGLSQAGVANKLRLLQLEQTVREAIKVSGLSERHARALLRLPDEAMRLEAVRLATEKEWRVRELEEWIRRRLEEPPSEPPHRQRVQGVYKDARIFVNSVKSLVEQMSTSGVPIAYDQVEAPGYIEVRVRIETGKEHEA